MFSFFAKFNQKQKNVGYLLLTLVEINQNCIEYKYEYIAFAVCYVISNLNLSQPFYKKIVFNGDGFYELHFQKWKSLKSNDGYQFEDQTILIARFEEKELKKVVTEILNSYKRTSPRVHPNLHKRFIFNDIIEMRNLEGDQLI